MGLKIDPEIASKTVNEYLREVDDLLKGSYANCHSKKSNLDSKVKAFITTSFDDSDKKLRSYSKASIKIFTIGGPVKSDEEKQKEAQQEYISDLHWIKKHLIEYKEEISLILASQNYTKESDKKNIAFEREEIKGVEDSFKMLQESLEDLKILIISCEEDIGKDASVSYKLYVNEYNEILLKLNSIGYLKEFEPIEVELEARYMTPLPPFEQAKLKEIISNSKKLINRLQKLVKPESDDYNVTDILELIFSRFHIVAKQLEKRHNNRNTLIIDDEYDVQDLLHSLLRIYFDDVRPEEPTPSYGAKSSRIDFLLKNESIAVEIKFARKDSDKKKITTELIDDKERYKAHPNVQKLYCFVYNHNHAIINSAEIEELSEKNEHIEVFVYLKPNYL